MSDVKRLKRDLDEGRVEDVAVTLMSLPGDVRINIAQYLPIRSILNLSEVNRDFANWARNSQLLWPMLFQRNFGDQISLERLINTLRVAFPHYDLDYSYDNYKTLTLAYSAVTNMEDFINDKYYLQSSDQMITIEESSIRQFKYHFMTTIVQRKSNVVDEMLSSMPEFVYHLDYQGSKSYHFNYLFKTSPLLTNLLSVIIRFKLMVLGFKPLSVHHTIKSQIPICSHCSNNPAKFTLEPHNVLVCSQECANQVIEIKRV